VTYSDGAAYIDGVIVPIHEAKISVLDWGFLHSDATYDVVHVWDGRFFRLKDHLNRFYENMIKLHLTIPYSRTELTSILTQCVKVSSLRNAYVEMICTRGIPKQGSRDPRKCSNQFYAFAIPFVWIADQEKQNQGLHVVISSKRRIPPTSVDPTIKNYHWLDFVAGLYEAYDQGGETTILVDEEGRLLEGPGFNIFAITGNTIKTPGQGVLEGITRKTVVELAPSFGLQVIMGDLSPHEALNAGEVFISSTAGGIMPVTMINGIKIGTGVPGPMTKRLKEAYWDLHKDPQFTLAIDYEQYVALFPKAG
jgi:branched-chain amino acid aminotransferase